MVQKWMTLDQAAELAGVHYDTMRTLANSGKVRSRRAGLGKTAPILVNRFDAEKARLAYGLRQTSVLTEANKQSSRGKGPTASGGHPR